MKHKGPLSDVVCGLMETVLEEGEKRMSQGEGEIIPGIVGLAIVALVFAACLAVERLVHKNIPESGNYFWQGNAAGAVAGVILLVVWMVRGNYVRSFWDIFDQENFLSIVFTGSIMGMIPGGLLGLAFGWVSSKLQKKTET